MSEKWWIYIDDEISDEPFSKEELKEQSDFNLKTNVCRVDEDEWKEAHDDPKLVELFQPEIEPGAEPSESDNNMDRDRSDETDDKQQETAEKAQNTQLDQQKTEEGAEKSESEYKEQPEQDDEQGCGTCGGLLILTALNTVLLLVTGPPGIIGYILIFIVAFSSGAIELPDE